MEPYASSSDDTIIYNLEAEIGQQDDGNVPPACPGTSRLSIRSDPAIVPDSTPTISTPADPNASQSGPEEPDDLDTSTPITPPKLKRGRPKGKAKPHTGDFSHPASIQQKNVHHDRVDKECIRLNIVYWKWCPLNPQQQSHVSIRDINDDREIPDEQEIPEWCILCPCNSFLKDRKAGLNHYR